MRPEDITGVNPEGWRVHVDGCTCDHNEITRRELIEGSSPRSLKVVVERIVTRLDPECAVHR